MLKCLKMSNTNFITNDNRCRICGTTVMKLENQKNISLCSHCSDERTINTILGYWSLIKEQKELNKPLDIAKDELLFIAGATGSIIIHYKNVQHFSKLLNSIFLKLADGKIQIGVFELVRSGFRGKTGFERLQNDLKLLKEIGFLKEISSNNIIIEKESILNYLIKMVNVDHINFGKLWIPSIITGIAWIAGLSTLYEEFIQEGNVNYGDGLTKIYVNTKKGIQIPKAVNSIIMSIFYLYNMAKDDGNIGEIKLIEFLSSRINTSDYYEKVRPIFYGTGAGSEYFTKLWDKFTIETGNLWLNNKLIGYRDNILERGRQERERLRSLEREE